MGRAEPRLLLRGPRPGDSGRGRDLTAPRRVPIDAAVVPGLLLLIARDLSLFDPVRVLAWRLFHDGRLAEAAAGLGPLLPSPSGELDRDPVALLLATCATLLALAYGALAVAGARPSRRAAVLALAAVLLIVLPSVAFIAMGVATDRPYGQDGGVVQLPLALEVLLRGESPYAADYSGTMLARQARVSAFWQEYGGNPILHHHAYLPGTHLVMMPFYLGSRALLGLFDPRFVTLLFYVLVVILAARLPETDDARLAAAGLAALNPLVYWHQIFGANDLVFVALILAAVLATRQGRRVLGGAALGLACATKQLAWPYAPFLLVAMSGARGWRDLRTPGSWKRLGAPLAAAALVFLVVVVPVAAIDFDAFWGDIVEYNMGLPGDNYPLGGTPGFGFANFLIYFGRVQSLGDHVSFSGFYILLIPLGLLLVHRQMREGGAETALATGSIALVAAVYFSRVVHPNYLIPAAVLLPVGALARRLRADLALVPLLLFALAIEIAEGAIFRTTWDQAAAANLPARLGGLASALVPRAGPHLTRDPLGLLFSAMAGGLAVLYLMAGVARASRRVRLAIVGVAGLLLVVAPLLVMVGVGDRTGLIGAQDRYVVQSAGDAKRLAALRSPYREPLEDTPRGRQAYATSFRLEPPAEIRPDHPTTPPGTSLLATVGHLAGHRDVRLWVLLALALLVAVIARSGGGTAAMGLTLLLAPLALGAVLGATMTLPLAALAAGWLLARRGPPWAAGLLAGLAMGLDHRAALLAPLLLLPLARRPAAIRTALVWSLGVYGLVVLPVALLDVTAYAGRQISFSPPGAGLGVFNILAYYGVEGSTVAHALAAFTPLAALLVTVALLRGSRPPLALAGLAALAGIALAPALSPDAVAVPIVLLGLSALVPEDGEPPSARAESTPTGGAPAEPSPPEP